MSGMRVTLDMRKKGARINRHVYGHFSEHLGKKAPCFCGQNPSGLTKKSEGVTMSIY